MSLVFKDFIEFQSWQSGSYVIVVTLELSLLSAVFLFCIKLYVGHRCEENPNYVKVSSIKDYQYI